MPCDSGYMRPRLLLNLGGALTLFGLILTPISAQGGGLLVPAVLTFLTLGLFALLIGAALSAVASRREMPTDARLWSSDLGRVIMIGGGLALIGLIMIPVQSMGPLNVFPGLFVLLVGVVFSEAASRNQMSPAVRRWWSYLGVAGIFWLAPAVALLLGYLTLPDYNASGQCEGIGFGCTLTPKDGVHFAALFVYPVGVVAGLLVMAVIAGTRAWRRRRPGV